MNRLSTVALDPEEEDDTDLRGGDSEDESSDYKLHRKERENI